MNLINENSLHCTNIWDESAQYPDITVNNKNETFIVWQKYLNHNEEIIFAQIKDNKVVNPTKISKDGLALRPSIHSFNDSVYIVWSEFCCGKWNLYFREYCNGTFKEIRVIDSGEALFYPSVNDDSKNPVVVYNSQGIGYSNVMISTISNSINTVQVNLSKKCYRPSFAVDSFGNSYVAYDCYNGKNYDVIIRGKINDKWSDEIKISGNTINSTHPVIARNSDGVSVAWYENGSNCYFNNCVRDIRVSKSEIILDEIVILSENYNWYNNIDLTSNDSGKLVCTYTWGKYNAIAKIRDETGWSNPMVLTFNDGHCAVRPKVSLSNDDVLNYTWQFANRNGHEHRNASVIFNKFKLEDGKKFYDLEIEKKIDQFIQPIKADKKLGFHDEETVLKWLDKNGYKDKKLGFGDIHGQSNLSDALGEIDQYYHFAKNGANMDFCALTDHDNYPDIATDSEWEWNRTTRNLFNGEENFAVLLAYEWTSNEYHHDFGHKNVYYPSSKGGLYKSTEPSGNTPYTLFESIKKDGGQCIPHHPAADWGLVSAATDWDYVDDKAQRLVEIFSRHADFEKYESRSRFTKNISKKQRCCVQDALISGIRLGIIAGSDSHQMEHGIEGGIMAAYYPSLSSKNVFEAMYNRQVYGTTGARILLSFKINDCMMGQEILISKNNNIVKGKVSVLAIDEIEKVEVIKNNEVLISKNPEGIELDFEFEDHASNGDYYYIRVEQKDDHCAWSSPIWIDM